jgi:hypothetical protein
MTITKAVGELDRTSLPAGRERSPGGKCISLLAGGPSAPPGVLESPAEPLAMGDPGSPPRWPPKKSRVLAGVPSRTGRLVSQGKGPQLLRQARRSLQDNREARERAEHPDCHAVFRRIDENVTRVLAVGEPVIPVDSRKKGRVGRYQNTGRQFQTAKPLKILSDHGVPDPSVSRVYLNGIHDLVRNGGLQRELTKASASGPRVRTCSACSALTPGRRPRGNYPRDEIQCHPRSRAPPQASFRS